MHSPAILEAIVNELKAMFNVSCPILFDDSLDSRGKYYFRSKQIKINAAKQSLLQVIESICHEIVHYKQHQHGKLEVVTKGHYVFDGKTYVDVPYKEQPWELEANHYMTKLFTRFVEKAPYKLVERLRELEAGYILENA